MNNLLAKIMGWTQFGMTAATQVFSTQPHGWQGWLVSFASLAAGIGIHAASSTDGAK